MSRASQTIPDPDISDWPLVSDRDGPERRGRDLHAGDRPAAELLGSEVGDGVVGYRIEVGVLVLLVLRLPGPHAGAA